MTKIPVKIIELTAPSGKKSIEVMIDVYDYHGIEDAQKKIKVFKKEYFELVKKAQGILPKKSKRKSSHFWALGNILYDFNRSIKNKFEITNFNSAIARDFGLYQANHSGAIIQFGEFFKKKDISEKIPMSTYLELIFKASAFKKSGILEEEKKRLLRRAKDKTLPSHKEYRQELIALEKTTN